MNKQRQLQYIFNVLMWADVLKMEVWESTDASHQEVEYKVIKTDPFHIPDKDWKKMCEEFDKAHKGELLSEEEE